MFELTAKRKKKWVQHETTINNPYTCNFVLGEVDNSW